MWAHFLIRYVVSLSLEGVNLYIAPVFWVVHISRVGELSAGSS